MVSSKKVVLLEKTWNALFAQAAREGMVAAAPEAINDLASLDNEEAVAKALSLLVIFEEVIAPHHVSIESPRIPLLEEAGFFKPVSDTLGNLSKLKPNWTMDKDGEKLFKALTSILEKESILISRLTAKMDLDGVIRAPDNISRAQYYSAVFRHVHGLCSHGNVSFTNTPLRRIYSDETVKRINLNLMRKDRSLDNSNSIDLLLLAAIAEIDHLEIALSLSRKYKAATTVPVMTNCASIKVAENALDRSEMFHLLQIAMDQETEKFPKVQTIKDALKLRADPNVRAFRTQLIQFQQALYDGEVVDLPSLRDEVRKAHAVLVQKSQCDDVLKLINYITYSAAMAETLQSSVPYVGLTVATIGFLCDSQSYLAQFWRAICHHLN